MWHKEGYDIDEFNPDDTQFGFWTSKDGDLKKISTIENNYFENIIKFLKSKYPDCSKLVEFKNEKRLRTLEEIKNGK